jgi:polyphosphate:AMP phosphotransferase
VFETAELGVSVDKEAYKREVPKLREGLLAAQGELAASDLAVVVVIGGVEGAGKTETVNQLLEWVDARGIETHAMGAPTDEERERPPMWRFWRLLPPRGRMGIFLGSWYTDPIVQRVFGDMGVASFEKALDRLVEFERMLAQEGVVVVKFWLHLRQTALVKRMTALERDPLQSWRVTPQDWKFVKRYKRFRRVSEIAVLRTGIGEAPWHIVEAIDSRHRNLAVGKTLLHVLQDRLAAWKSRPKPQRLPDLPKPSKVNIIRNLDLSLALDDVRYEEDLLKCMAQLNLLARRLYEKRRSLTLVFEGPDAAGKGGTIRRLTAAMDARNYQHIAVAAPTDEERARPYLWRFWRNLPRRGRVTIYDRSWYGRVLVERIEGFCTREDWQRAYAEINAFEESLTDFGIILIKFWLAIGPQEQLRRFKDRRATPYKQYKITEEDWRNRAKWDAYEAAAVEMIEKTCIAAAPWILVEAADKNYARIKVMKTVVRHLKKELD